MTEKFTSYEMRRLVKSGDEGESGAGDMAMDPITGLNLPAENEYMAIERRILEQSNEGQLARVHRREKHPERGAEMGQQDKMESHPLLDSQRFDGIDPNQTPDPQINPDSRWIFENERADQEKKKELRLGNELQNRKQQTFTSVPTPRPGR